MTNQNEVKHGEVIFGGEINEAMPVEFDNELLASCYNMDEDEQMPPLSLVNLPAIEFFDANGALNLS